MLETEEYIEQEHFFGVVVDRLKEGLPMQELLAQAREETLATTRLPLAIDFMLSELTHRGTINTALRRLDHYFSPFQAFVIGQAEDDRGRFDMQTALQVLGKEAGFRSKTPTPAGSFFYQLETMCRNRLNYDQGLYAVAHDPIYDADWRAWILHVRKQMGLVELADLIYIRSQLFADRQRQLGQGDLGAPILFGPKEGKIAQANRHKDPLYLFAALQRHLGYPAVPRREPPDQNVAQIPLLLRRVERLELRLKLMEEEQRGGIDLSRFMPPQGGSGPPGNSTE